MFKIAVDIHGTLDKYPEPIIKLIKKFWDLAGSEFECHILSGPPISQMQTELIGICKKYSDDQVFYSHTFSMNDYIRCLNIPHEWDEDATIWTKNEEDWNKIKGDYCKLHKIDLILDNTLAYQKYCPEGTFIGIK
jgi:hypothetical protein